MHKRLFFHGLVWYNYVQRLPVLSADERSADGTQAKIV